MLRLIFLLPHLATRSFAAERVRLADKQTLVMRPCMMRKWGLLTLSCTEWKRFWTWLAWTVWPLMMYLFFPPITTLDAGAHVSTRNLHAGHAGIKSASEERTGT